jgi:transcription termination/antitermination protein NusA
MKSEFVLALNQISAERTLPREVITRVIEQAIVQSYRKYANIMAAQAVSSLVDIDSGDMKVFLEKEVVDAVLDAKTEITLEDAVKHKEDAVMGDCIMVDVTPKDLGRIAAQNAKQMIVQKLREAEKDFQYSTFVDQEGELVSGNVQSLTPTGVTVNLGRIEAQLPKKEWIPGEKYEPQQRVRAYVAEVKRLTRGPQVILSRAHKGMLRRLLELEVPEVQSGAVEIKAISREPGSRSKVAVAALQAGIDPVGACVGQRGSRIQNIITELRGEKIDIIEWNADPGVFITKSLGPAKVMSVHPITEAKSASVIVPDDQLSLAIGREGQNARLAARLTGWRIDIKSGSGALTEAMALFAESQPAADWLGAETTAEFPALRELLVRQRALPQALSPDEFALVKRVIDSAYQWRQAHAATGEDGAAEQPRPAILEERKAARDAALAAIPKAAYAMSLDELGLSTRVTQHINAAGIVNVGQLLEYSSRGDEGLLSIPNIGSKALGEIKQSLEKVVGKPAAPVAEAAAVVAPVEDVAPSVVETPVEAAPSAPAAAAPAATPTPAAKSDVEETPEEAQRLFMNAVGKEEGIDVDDDDAPAADGGVRVPRGKKNKKGKERALYYDEELGRMVQARTHRRGEDATEE